MEETLLEKAKKIDTCRKSSISFNDAVECSVAWLKNEVSLTQIAVATGKKDGSGMYSSILRGIKQAFNAGKIKIVD